MASTEPPAQNGHAISNSTKTPFWNVNIPPAEHTPTCPPYLLYALTDLKDQAILATPDAAFPTPTWPETVATIRANRLDLLKRVPSDLRLYRKVCADLVAQHGSIMDFIVHERLRWGEHLTPSGAPLFENPSDYTILRNDWPYALPASTTHIVVWTKFPLPSAPDSALGDLSPSTRSAIDAFVTSTFVGEDDGKCAAENVLWFRNWAALKSVHAVEHFHVIVKDAPDGFVEMVTGGDVAQQEKVKREMGI